jgi:hypothetical protein
MPIATKNATKPRIISTMIDVEDELLFEGATY